MRHILLLTLIISVDTFGQNTIHGRVFTMVDNKPISHFRLQVGKKQFIDTDSTGFFSISTTKSKIKITFPHALFKSKDTTVFMSDSSKSISLFSSVSWDSSQAKYEIQNNTMRLFCCSGFLVSAPTQKDKDFEKEFGVRYYIMGDAPPAPIEKLRSYNAVIIQYLDKKYGAEWRKIARQ